jgi:long-subunit acyl-CoA synthetase (AMP-forming)
MSRTIHHVFADTVKNHPKLPALREKVNGQWQTTTWEDYSKIVRTIARGFMKLGVEKGDGVSIIGANCKRWFIADLAAIAAGGVPAGIYTTSSPEQCQYITEHSDSVVVVVQNAEHLAKFKQVRDQLPKVKALVLMNGEDDAADVHSWEDLKTLAEDTPDADLQARIDAQAIDDTCTLIYTSGTTGQPKAVMITHGNVVLTGDALMKTYSLNQQHVVSYLPLSHVAEQMVSLHGPIATAGCTWFAESIEALGDTLREVRPHMFLAVPRVWEKIQEKMVAAGKDSPWLRKKIVAWARRTGLAGGYAEQEGRPKPLFYGLANKLIYSKVKTKLGLDRCELQFTSAAPIARDTLDFFMSLGVRILEIYGMSECTGPATISLPGKYKTGKAGFALPGTELKIAEDGEVCMRGFHVFKGYLKNEAATQEAIDSDGWLHSGDIGEIDAQGLLQITDRKKDLLITAGGENVAPQVIEGHLKGIPVVSQAVVVGDRRKYLAALLTLDPEKVKAEATSAGSAATDVASAATCDAFKAHLQSQVDVMNAKLARVQTIKRWTVVPHEFTVEGEELTPTMKIRRKVIREKHAAAIEGLYA